MATLVFLMLFLSMCFRHGFTAKSPPSVNMYDHCNRIISMTDSNTKSVIIHYEHDSGILDRFFKIECTLELSGWKANNIALQFTSFDMASTKTTVEIRQGESWASGVPIDGLPMPFSTFNRLKHMFYTHWWRVFIRVKGKAPPDRKRIFTMVLNVFHGGPCLTGEHECANGRCIDEELKCNGHNPCGDLSDCREVGLQIQKIAIIVCITVATVLLLTFVLCKTVAHLCNRSKRRQSDSRDDGDMLASGTDSGGMAVTYSIIDNSSVTHGSTNHNAASYNGHVPVFHDEGRGTGDGSSVEQPPPYHTVISGEHDLSEYESDYSESETPPEAPDGDNHPAPPDYRTAVGETDTLERRHRRRPRRPARRHSSRYLPRYSEVLRHKDAYEVRGDEESVS